MTNKNRNENAMTRCNKTDLFLNACVAVLFVSTITTCGVRGNQIPLEGESLQSSVNDWNQINHLLQEGQDDQYDSLEPQSRSFYEKFTDMELPKELNEPIDGTDQGQDDIEDGETAIDKRAIPRMYKKSAIPRMYKKSAIPRMYKRAGIPRMYRRSGNVPRLYKKRSEDFGVPRMYKRDEENADIAFQIYKKMPRLYKKSGAVAENDDDSQDMQWLREVRNTAFPRLYKKNIPRMYKRSSIPRIYKKSDHLVAVRLGRSMTPRLYKKSYLTKKAILTQYKKDKMPRLY